MTCEKSIMEAISVKFQYATYDFVTFKKKTELSLYVSYDSDPPFRPLLNISKKEQVTSAIRQRSSDLAVKCVLP